MPRPLVSTNSSGTRSAQREVVHREEHRRAAPQAALVLAAGEHPSLGEAEVPQGRSLRGEDRRGHVVDAGHVREQRQQQGVDHQPGRAHDAEAAEARGDSWPSSSRPELAQVAQRLPRRCLGLAGVPLAEPERDLGHRQPGRPHEDLEQDLEAARAQAIEVHRVAPDQEAPAHRVGHVPQARREQQHRRARRDPRQRAAQAARRALVPAGAEPARDDDVGGRLRAPPRTSPRAPRAGAGGRRPSRTRTARARPACPRRRRPRARRRAPRPGDGSGRRRARTRSPGSRPACRRRCRRRR